MDGPLLYSQHFYFSRLVVCPADSGSAVCLITSPPRQGPGKIAQADYHMSVPFASATLTVLLVLKLGNAGCSSADLSVP